MIMAAVATKEIQSAWVRSSTAIRCCPSLIVFLIAGDLRILPATVNSDLARKDKKRRYLRLGSFLPHHWEFMLQQQMP
jgi:hypothetical protein